MATQTVGTGYTFATISAAIAAAAAGDFVAVYAGGVGNVYNEQVSIAGQALHVQGMLPNQGISISWGAAHTVLMADNITGRYLAIKNFTVINTGGFNGVNQSNNAGTAVRCESIRAFQTGAAGVSAGIMVCNGGTAGGPAINALNCTASGFGWGFRTNASRTGQPWFCTAVNSAISGFDGQTAGYPMYCRCCVGAGNAVDYSGVFSAENTHNVSADLTAPGLQAVTGFNPADFVNIATGDVRIAQAARLTTLARILGYPLLPTDITGRRRPSREPAAPPADNNFFYAGAYHCFEQPTWGPGELSGIV